MQTTVYVRLVEGFASIVFQPGKRPMYAKTETSAGPATALESPPGELLGKPSFAGLSSLMIRYFATIVVMPSKRSADLA
jgi:hypothetical protein